MLWFINCLGSIYPGNSPDQEVFFLIHFDFIKKTKNIFLPLSCH